MSDDCSLPDLTEANIESLLSALRLQDATQYFTLIKMHLSFATDLSTDECDGMPDECSTGGNSRWTFSPLVRKLTRGSSGLRGSNECVPLTNEGVKQASLLMKFINEDENLVQEGLFRKTGSLTRQQELRTALLSGPGVSSYLSSGLYNAHDCASVLKGVLQDLPEPLLQESHYYVHCRIADMCGQPSNKRRQIKALRLVFLLLPKLNFELLKELLLLLNRVASYKDYNRMTSINLGTMFAPHFLCPRKMSASELQNLSMSLSTAVAFMIENATELFHIPIELEMDVRQYWMNKREARSDSSKHAVPDAPTSTIFTFIDRKLTAQANEKDMTQVALAELYAYVQSIPDSSKKRRLIKQFNEASGCGTPTLNHSRHKKELKIKTLGDSIKRHLFSKGLKSNKKANLTIKGKSYIKDDFIGTSTVCCSPELRLFKRNTARHFRSKSVDDLSSPEAYIRIPQTKSAVYVSTYLENSMSTPKSRTREADRKSPSRTQGENIYNENIFNKKTDENSRGNPIHEIKASTPIVDWHPCSKVVSVDRHNIFKLAEYDSPISSRIVHQSQSEKPFRPMPSAQCTHNEDEAHLSSCGILVLTSPKMEALSNSVSPISRAFMRSNFNQDVIMTPRSRCPIIIKSPSNLSSNDGDDKSMTTDELSIHKSSQAPSENIYPPKCDTHTSEAGLHSTRISDYKTEEKSAVYSNNFYNSQVEEKNNQTIHGSPVTRVNSRSRLPKIISSASNTSGSLFGSFFKQLSTGSLVQLASKLTSMSSLHAENSFSPCLETQDEFLESSVLPDLDESLSSVFKEYIIGRSILTENPVDLSVDGMGESKADLTDDDSVFNEGSYVPSIVSSVAQGSKASTSTVCSTDSGVEQLSDSLLYCLDGNIPDLASSREQRKISASMMSDIKDLNLPSPKKHCSERISKSDMDPCKENMDNIGLCSCSPNGRRHSLLKNKQGTPKLNQDEHLKPLIQMCNDDDMIGEFIETAF